MQWARGRVTDAGAVEERGGGGRCGRAVVLSRAAWMAASSMISEVGEKSCPALRSAQGVHGPSMVTGSQLGKVPQYLLLVCAR